MTVEELLARARAGLVRLGPHEAAAAMAEGALLVDVRGDVQRERDGVVPGTIHHPRNVLEWRADPRSAWRDPRIAFPDAHVIVMCDEGYQSSLAAANLQALGLARATDLIGGFHAWRAAGLPVRHPGEAAGGRI
jgi:rhodanese-related sulfurtransferase